MHFEIDTKILKEGIDIVNHASLGISTTPILENIMISVQYKKIILTANNLEMAIEYVIDSGINIKSEGSFTISNRFISSLLGLLRDDRVEIELISNSTLVFRTPGSETKFKGIDAKEFPIIPTVKRDCYFNISSKDLKSAIEKTLFSTAEGNIRPTLAGIYMSIKDDSVIFASTDSFRLSEYKIQSKIEVNELVSIIIPAKTAGELYKILPENEMVEIFVNENQFLASFKDIKLFSRLLNGHFPDYESFFPKSYSTRGVIMRSELIGAIKRTNLITKENNYSTKIIFDSVFGIEINTGDTEIGAGVVKIPASIEGENNTIGLNSMYLLDVMNIIKDDYISIDFETPLSPIMIRGIREKETLDTYKHIIMPLKV